MVDHAFGAGGDEGAAALRRLDSGLLVLLWLGSLLGWRRLPDRIPMHFDPAGRPVPAEFRVLARWNAGLEDREAPIQWVLVTFPGTVGEKQSAVYSLSVDGSVANPPPPLPLTLTRKGGRGQEARLAESWRQLVDKGHPHQQMLRRTSPK